MRLALILALALPVLPAADRVTLTGKVIGTGNRPLANATVIVYQAGVKKGYSTFCPTCYADCGKRALTSPDGSYTIASLSADLWFRLLVVHDGYTPLFLDHADPSQGPASTALLQPRRPATGTSYTLRGRIVNTHGRGIRDAVIEPQGLYRGERRDTGLSARSTP
jgi:protocatechuate 3,4-dioxygenase beta subunit